MNTSGIDRVACIGAGTIGSSWATYFITKGIRVSIQDLNNEILERSEKRIVQYLKSLLVNEVITEQQQQNAKELITYTTSICEAVDGAQFIQESALERYDIKESVIEEVDKYTTGKVIFASSSSGLLASKLQEYSKYPGRVIVAHPFNPPHLIPLVEIVRGRADEETVQTAAEFYKSIGKVPILLNKEVPGHVANRIQAAIWRESIDLVMNGVCSVKDVDSAVCYGPGLRWALMGPNMIFHLGGGDKGIKGFLAQLQEPFESWWDDMAYWKRFPDKSGETLASGLEEAMGKSSISDMAQWRDGKLIAILKDLSLI